MNKLLFILFIIIFTFPLYGSELWHPTSELVDLETSTDLELESLLASLPDPAIDFEIVPSQPTVAKGFQCELCSKSFSHKVNLTRHRKTIHTGMKPFECTICKKKFSRKERLTAHERTHTGEDLFKCFICV